MKDCRKIQEKLSFYIEGEEKLSLAEEEHLKNCSLCQKEYEDLKDTMSLTEVLDMEVKNPPENFRSEIMKTLALEESLFQKILKAFSKKKIVFSALATSLLLFVIIFSPLSEDFSQLGALPSDSEILESSDEFVEVSQENFKLPARSLKTNKTFMHKEEAGTQDKKIIKNVNASLEVNDYKKTAKKILTEVGNLDGYISNENTYIWDEKNKLFAGNLTIRIPETNFQSFLDYLEDSTSMVSESIYSEDVTEEYIDLESRLKVLREKEARLLELLKEAKDVQGIVSIESELSATRADLESLEARSKHLENRISFSTFNLEIKEKSLLKEEISANSPGELFKKAQDSFVYSLNFLLLGIKKIIMAIFFLLPFFLLAFLIFLLISFISKHKGSKK